VARKEAGGRTPEGGGEGWTPKRGGRRAEGGRRREEGGGRSSEGGGRSPLLPPATAELSPVERGNDQRQVSLKDKWVHSFPVNFGP
jgi:hypothetical protein